MKKFLINLVPIGKVKHKLQARFLKQPELNITRNSKCLMVCPHPDDEMIGAGACMIEHHRNFDCVCISSSGLRYKNITPRQRSDIRINEFNAVMDFVGVKNRYIFETFGVPPFISQIKRHFWDYIDTLDTQKYDYIFLPHPNDNHPEHRFVSNILMKRILRKNGFNKELFP